MEMYFGVKIIALTHYQTPGLREANYALSGRQRGCNIHIDY
jgi:hypothetical protein